MLTEAQVRTAVANGIKFLNRTREPYGLWFMGMMHSRFGVPEFADALKRYDEVIAERPKEAPVLRVLRRLLDANNPLQPDDWDHVLIHTDRLLAAALYCDRLGLPESYAEVLEKGVKAGGYHATHVLLAWIWLQDNRCQLAVRDGFVEDMYRAIAAILEDQPDRRERPQARSRRVPLHGAPGQARGPSFRPARRLDPESGRRLGEARHAEPGQPGRVVVALDDAGPAAPAARRVPAARSSAGGQ